MLKKKPEQFGKSIMKTLENLLGVFTCLEEQKPRVYQVFKEKIFFKNK